MDIFIHHQDTDSILVIELKYIRIAFLERTQQVVNEKRYKIKHASWREENLRVSTLSRKMLLEDVKVRRHYNGSCFLESMDSILLKGINQADTYCRGLKTSGIRPVPKDTRLFRCVFLGIGSTVLGEPVLEIL